jgi:hypothetical protein
VDHIWKDGYPKDATEGELANLCKTHERYMQTGLTAMDGDSESANHNQSIREWYNLTEENPVAYFLRHIAIAEAVKAEREACAKIADDDDSAIYNQIGHTEEYPRYIAEAIRARE